MQPVNVIVEARDGVSSSRFTPQGGDCRVLDLLVRDRVIRNLQPFTGDGIAGEKLADANVGAAK